MEEKDKADTRDEDRRDGLLDIVERCGIVSAVNPREKHEWEDEEHTEHSYELSGLCGTLAWIAPQAELDRNKGIASVGPIVEYMLIYIT